MGLKKKVRLSVQPVEKKKVGVHVEGPVSLSECQYQIRLEASRSRAGALRRYGGRIVGFTRLEFEAELKKQHEGEGMPLWLFQLCSR